MNINPLRVFNQLPLLGLRVGEFDDTGGNGEKLRQLRGAETPRPCNDLEALVVRPDGDGLNQAVVFDGLGKFVQLRLIEGAAGVGGGLMNGVNGKKLKGAAVLHDALLGLGLAVAVAERTRFPVSAPLAENLG